jgi:hypothetical protein
MEVNSRWSGRRGVCLPFTDECTPIGGGDTDQDGTLYQEALRHGRERGWKYFEVRGGGQRWGGNTVSEEYLGHRLDLTCGEEALCAGLSDTVRRGIRKAEKEGLRIERSTSLDSMKAFYALHCQTRRRHGVPPQPFRFFEAVVRHVLSAGHGFVFTAVHQARIVAAAVFFHHGKQALYKYGASDAGFQALRPNNLLMWEAIRWYQKSGLATLSFGRTSLDATGLRHFKLGFGALESRIEYCRYDLRREKFVPTRDRSRSGLTPLFRSLPLPVLRFAGSILYPHLS